MKIIRLEKKSQKCNLGLAEAKRIVYNPAHQRR